MFASGHSLRNNLRMSSLFPTRKILCLTSFCWFALFCQAGTAQQEAEAAVQALARDQENAGFMFRAEVWSGEISNGLGKAVRMQLFKGNEYCIGVAVPRDSGVRITGAVLDLDAKPVGEIQPVLDGWGFLLFFKPKKTGVYVVTLREEESGKQKDTTCAIITGYK